MTDSITLSSQLRSVIANTALVSPGRGAHLGGALSIVDFLSVLSSYFTLSQSISPDSFRLTLSKGHSCLAQYALSSIFGLITPEILSSFESDESPLCGHPTRNPPFGINFSTGSLGMGLPCVIGQALYLHKTYSNQSPLNVVVVGDGEFSEGVIFESLSLLKNLNLPNVLVFIDCNGFQQTGPVYPTQSFNVIVDIIKALNLHHIAIDDAHDHQQLRTAFDELSHDSPTIFIGRTIKGKGFSRMEADNIWHHRKLTTSDLD